MLQKLMVGFSLESIKVLISCCLCVFALVLNATCFLWLGGFSVFAGVGERTREGNEMAEV